MGIETGYAFGFAVAIAAGLLASMTVWQTLSNVGGGAILRLCPRFNVGDYIIVKDEGGRVTKIGWVATYLESPDGLQISFPHTLIAGSKVKNLSSHSRRRVEVAVELSDMSVDETRVLLIAAAHNVDEILEAPAPAVVLVSVDSSSSHWQVRGWVDAEHAGPAVEALLASVQRFLDLAESLPRHNIRPSPYSLSA